MIIGIDASRAFIKRRTGIEEYAYQVVSHLREELADESVILYIRQGQEVNLALPPKWDVRALAAPKLWTQVRLSWEILWHAPDVLLVPAHTVPILHPKRSVVVVHGLEYEFCPRAYSVWERWYMRISIWCSVRWASRVICVSENTKRDVTCLYGVPTEKITVIGEGYAEAESMASQQADEAIGTERKPKDPYFLFIGRIEERKNIARVIEAFDLFKKETGLPHKLVLAGKPGYGYEEVAATKARTQYRDDILELGFVTEEEKWALLRGAEAFVFATLYEGFGIPIMEAQSVGTAIITSTTSSLPEVAGEGAILVDPLQPAEIAEALCTMVSDPAKKSAIIAKGKENLGRYGWDKCAKEIAEVLVH